MPNYYQTMSNLAKSQVQSYLKRSVKQGLEEVVTESRDQRQSATPVKKLNLPAKDEA